MHLQCMYVCIRVYVSRSSLQPIGCHDGAMIDCRLYRTFQSLTVNRNETVTCREVSVAMSSKVLARLQSMRNFVVHSS